MIRADKKFPPALIFISPSGTGIKIFYRIKNAIQEDHGVYLKALFHYVHKTYKWPADQSCTDIPRACLLCYDLNARYSPSAEIESSELLDYLSEIPLQPAEGSLETELDCLQEDPAFAAPVQTRPAASLPNGPAASLPNGRPAAFLSATEEGILETRQAASVQASGIPDFKTLILQLKTDPALYDRAIRDLENAGWKKNSDKHWTRPGKKRGTSAEFKQKDGVYKFKVYSSNAVNFSTDRSYDNIDIIGKLEFNGDNKACLKSLFAERGLSFKQDYKKAELPQPEDSVDYFVDRDIQELMEAGKNEKPRRKIGGAFLYENTITYLFSRTNYGKSLLVFQLAYAAATGTNLACADALMNDCKPMKVLVVDLEMEPQDLYERHGIALQCMEKKFVKNLHYLHEKPDNNLLFGENLLKKIEDYVSKHKSKLVIIDNLSKLLPDSLKPELVTTVISSLRRIKQRTGASFLVIGHTTKGNPRVAIQPGDYFGSSMVQNFFSEVSYLDMTIDGNYFLCHTKTKRPECYQDTVPVFERCMLPKLGIGFNYIGMRYREDIQLPLMLGPAGKPKKRNLINYLAEVRILDQNGIPRNKIAEMMDVSRTSVYNLLEKSL